MSGRLALTVFLVFLVGALGALAWSDSPGSPRGVGAHTWECWQFETDFSEGCIERAHECAGYCFYAECVLCSDDFHEHEYCSGGEPGGDPETCNVYLERHGVSPCKRWVWHLYTGPEGGAWSFGSDNLGEALHFAFSPPKLVPSECLEEALPKPTPMQLVPRSTTVPEDEYPGVNPEPESVHRTAAPGFCEEEPCYWRSAGSNQSPVTVAYLQELLPAVGSVVEALYEGGQVTGEERDFLLGPVAASGLVVVEGGEGAPTLDAVRFVGEEGDPDDVVELVYSGVGSDETVQYRYWVYNGTVPSVVREPFRALSGTVQVVQGQERLGLPGLGAVGVYGFQVRSLGQNEKGEPVYSPGSNVVYEFIGGQSFRGLTEVDREARNRDVRERMQPLPVTARLELAPTLQEGQERPATPVVVVVRESEETLGRVWVEVAGLGEDFSGNIEYRVWAHTGFDPVGEEALWKTAAPEGGSFPVEGVIPPREPDEDRYLPRYWDFQVRVMGSDGVVSLPSDSYSTLVVGLAGRNSGECYAELGDLGAGVKRAGELTEDCHSAVGLDKHYVVGEHELTSGGERYARWFGFRVVEPGLLEVRAGGMAGLQVYVLRGRGGGGDIVGEGPGGVTLQVEVKRGVYTVEVTTTGTNVEGDFELAVGMSGVTGGLGLPCENGIAVPDPVDNPGLVRDCTLMLELAGPLGGSVDLGWSAAAPVAEWAGVTVSGDPARVTKLNFEHAGFDGELPQSLGLLDALVELVIRNASFNGGFPRAWGTCPG